MSIRLFDLPSKLPQKAYSAFVWKIRYILNHKNLPYKTTWVEYPDTPAVLRKLGVLDTAALPLVSPWPVIHDKNNGVVVGDSTDIPNAFGIVEYLERTYPPPEPEEMLIPPGAKRYQQYFLLEWKRCMKTIIPLTAQEELKIMTPRSKEQALKVRGLWPEHVKEMMAEKLWGLAERELGVLDRVWYRGSHVFLMGGEWPTYPDFVVASWMTWCRTVWGEDSVEWGERISKWHDGRWGRLLEVLKELEEIH